MTETLTVGDLIEELKLLDPDAVVVSPDKIIVASMHTQGIPFTTLKKRHFHANKGWITPEGQFFTDTQLAVVHGWTRPSKDSKRAYIIDSIGVDDES